jgi:ketosteroid isomerase-like protein
VLRTLGAILIGWACFAAGFVAYTHLRRSVTAEKRGQYLQPAGDAPAAVETGVRQTLRAFGDGYARRDPNAAAAFTDRLFAANGDALLLGVNGGEWIRGRQAVTQFIGDDWRYWGDLKVDSSNAVVWSQGDVAWTATTGALRTRGSDRPLRLTAVLIREGNQWRFRQVVFQWDDHDPETRDLFRPESYFQLWHRLTGKLLRHDGR